ncbi:nucleotide-binding universal stress UspA family protein [Desulfobotulus alkaliphilus]|uniref:Nucleotide-binding universal stress UspA family protein n=1 Tax=Desulfobotulus alkaliphilus TaxID=622671 RepID=A0A562S2E4_9BACT|nr:universal stress protein [Desulfobotulus alkaliphilus]TWI75298.1 nucleotide-binding universal stress UspA family protein [Desulfobotulus alkaliphilus]
MERKYLIALDGSTASMAVAHYAAAMLPRDRSEIVLFLVELDMPESFWDIYPDPENRIHKEEMAQWAERQKKCFASVLEAARSIFVEAGFPPKNIRIKMLRRNTGITRDIISESMDGYAAVFAGRKGCSNLARLPIGNVARKLVSRILHIPLVIVGESAETNHILIGFDDSRDSRNCLRLSAALFANTDKQFHILHIARSFNLFNGEFQNGESRKPDVTVGYPLDNQDKNRRMRIEPAMEKALLILKEHSVKKANMESRIVTGYMNRSLGLLDTAEKEGWGTIFVGRRGISRIQDFLMGRVGEKLVEMARDQAIWIVN